MVFQKHNLGVPIVAQWLKNLTLPLWGYCFHPWPCSVLSGLRIQCGYKLHHRSQMWLRYDVAWLWFRPVAAALIWRLACELPYATGVAIKKKKKMVPPGATGLFATQLVFVFLGLYVHAWNIISFLAQNIYTYFNLHECSGDLLLKLDMFNNTAIQESIIICEMMLYIQTSLFFTFILDV